MEILSLGVCIVRASALIAAVTITGCSKEEKPPKPLQSAGELVFVKNCKVCHAQGINGAPILGNKTMWGPRLPQGEAALVEHAIQGFGLMPPKGGKTHLPDSEVTLAVKYMISKAQ